MFNKKKLAALEADKKYSDERAQKASDRADAAHSAKVAAELDARISLDLIVDGLGIRDAYPDVTTHETVTDFRPVYRPYARGYDGYRYGGYSETETYSYESSTTDYGRDRFLADVKAATQSKAGSDAAARLAAALKAAK